MYIRKAEIPDIDQIMEIIHDGKAALRKADIDQWQNGYPNHIDIEKDIHTAGGYVLEEEHHMYGYCYINEMDDPNYHLIESGEWLNQNSYIVLHRTCVLSSSKGRGLASIFVQKAESLAKEKGLNNLRADTHKDNTSMRRMLKSNGFQECGIVYMSDGSPRIAYQKVL